jgi:alkylation response protein AidB-like acyl-CoA dehydrogenase
MNRRTSTDGPGRTSFPRGFAAGWRAAASAGLFGLGVSRRYGGRPARFRDVLSALTRFSQACPDNGLSLAAAVHLLTCVKPVDRFGTERLRRLVLPRLARGRWVGGQAVTEPEAGSDAFSLVTRCERRGGVYVLNGEKTLVTNAPSADLLLVYAASRPGAGAWGLNAFAVPTSARGFVPGRRLKTLGLASAAVGEFRLKDCRVPAEYRLGREGAGAVVFQTAMDWERAGVAALAVGAMERELRICVEYARRRRQFGRPVGKFQAVSHRLAGMKVRLEAARGLVRAAGEALDRSGRAGAETAAAKLFATEARLASAVDALRVHGGRGYVEGSGVPADVRDALGGVLYSGTSDILRNIIGRWLGL